MRRDEQYEARTSRAILEVIVYTHTHTHTHTHTQKTRDVIFKARENSISFLGHRGPKRRLGRRARRKGKEHSYLVS